MAGLRARHSVVPRARSKGRTESRPAQMNAVTASLGVVGAQRAL
jgi:hypothetical protein